MTRPPFVERRNGEMRGFPDPFTSCELEHNAKNNRMRAK